MVLLLVPAMRPCQPFSPAHFSTSSLVKNLPDLATQNGLESAINVPW
jgi:hypothetical protein